MSRKEMEVCWCWLFPWSPDPPCSILLIPPLPRHPFLQMEHFGTLLWFLCQSRITHQFCCSKQGSSLLCMSPGSNPATLDNLSLETDHFLPCFRHRTSWLPACAGNFCLSIPPTTLYQTQLLPCTEPCNPGELWLTLLMLSAYTSAAFSKWWLLVI